MWCERIGYLMASMWFRSPSSNSSTRSCSSALSPEPSWRRNEREIGSENVCERKGSALACCNTLDLGLEGGRKVSRRTACACKSEESVK